MGSENRVEKELSRMLSMKPTKEDIERGEQLVTSERKREGDHSQQEQLLQEYVRQNMQKGNRDSQPKKK